MRFIMKHMSKKMLSVILALMVLVSAVSVAFSAIANAPAETYVVTNSKPAIAMLSGLKLDLTKISVEFDEDEIIPGDEIAWTVTPNGALLFDEQAATLTVFKPGAYTITATKADEPEKAREINLFASEERATQVEIYNYEFSANDLDANGEFKTSTGWKIVRTAGTAKAEYTNGSIWFPTNTTAYVVLDPLSDGGKVVSSFSDVSVEAEIYSKNSVSRTVGWYGIFSRLTYTDNVVSATPLTQVGTLYRFCSSRSAKTAFKFLINDAAVNQTTSNSQITSDKSDKYKIQLTGKNLAATWAINGATEFSDIGYTLSNEQKAALEDTQNVCGTIGYYSEKNAETGLVSIKVSVGFTDDELNKIAAACEDHGYYMINSAKPAIPVTVGKTLNLNAALVEFSNGNIVTGDKIAWDIITNNSAIFNKDSGTISIFKAGTYEATATYKPEGGEELTQKVYIFASAIALNEVEIYKHTFSNADVVDGNFTAASEWKAGPTGYPQNERKLVYLDKSGNDIYNGVTFYVKSPSDANLWLGDLTDGTIYLDPESNSGKFLKQFADVNIEANVISYVNYGDANNCGYAGVLGRLDLGENGTYENTDTKISTYYRASTSNEAYKNTSLKIGVSGKEKVIAQNFSAISGDTVVQRLEIKGNTIKPSYKSISAAAANDAAFELTNEQQALLNTTAGKGGTIGVYIGNNTRAAVQSVRVTISFSDEEKKAAEALYADSPYHIIGSNKPAIPVATGTKVSFEGLIFEMADGSFLEPKDIYWDNPNGALKFQDNAVYTYADGFYTVKAKKSADDTEGRDIYFITPNEDGEYQLYEHTFTAADVDVNGAFTPESEWKSTLNGSYSTPKVQYITEHAGVGALFDDTDNGVDNPWFGDSGNGALYLDPESASGKLVSQFSDITLELRVKPTTRFNHAGVNSIGPVVRLDLGPNNAWNSTDAQIQAMYRIPRTVKDENGVVDDEANKTVVNIWATGAALKEAVKQDFPLIEKQINKMKLQAVGPVVKTWVDTGSGAGYVEVNNFELTEAQQNNVNLTVGKTGHTIGFVVENTTRSVLCGAKASITFSDEEMTKFTSTEIAPLYNVMQDFPAIPMKKGTKISLDKLLIQLPDGNFTTGEKLEWSTDYIGSNFLVDNDYKEIYAYGTGRCDVVIKNGDKKVMEAHIIVENEDGSYKLFEHTFTQDDADAFAEDGSTDMWTTSIHSLRTAKESGFEDINGIFHMGSVWKNSVTSGGSIMFDTNKGVSLYTNDNNLITLNPEHKDAKILSKFSDYVINFTASTRDNWNQRGYIGALGRVDFGDDNKLSFTNGIYVPNTAPSYENNRLSAKVGVVCSLNKINNLKIEEVEVSAEEFTWTALNGADKVTIDNEAHTIVASEPGIYNIEGVKGDNKVTVSYIVPHEDYLDHMVGGAFYVSESPSINVITYKGANGTKNKYSGNNTFSVPFDSTEFKYNIPDTYNFKVALKGNDISFYVAPNGTNDYAEVYSSQKTPLDIEQQGYMEASNKKTGTIALYSNGMSRAWFKSVSVSLDIPEMPSEYLLEVGKCLGKDERVINLKIGESIILSEVNFEVGNRYYNGARITFKNKPEGLNIVEGESITPNKVGKYSVTAVAGTKEFKLIFVIGAPSEVDYHIVTAQKPVVPIKTGTKVNFDNLIFDLGDGVYMLAEDIYWDNPYGALNFQDNAVYTYSDGFYTVKAKRSAEDTNGKDIYFITPNEDGEYQLYEHTFTAADVDANGAFTPESEWKSTLNGNYSTPKLQYMEIDGGVGALFDSTNDEIENPWFGDSGTGAFYLDPNSESGKLVSQFADITLELRIKPTVRFSHDGTGAVGPIVRLNLGSNKAWNSSDNQIRAMYRIPRTVKDENGVVDEAGNNTEVNIFVIANGLSGVLKQNAPLIEKQFNKLKLQAVGTNIKTWFDNGNGEGYREVSNIELTNNQQNNMNSLVGKSGHTVGYSFEGTTRTVLNSAKVTITFSAEEMTKFPSTEVAPLYNVMQDFPAIPMAQATKISLDKLLIELPDGNFTTGEKLEWSTDYVGSNFLIDNATKEIYAYGSGRYDVTLKDGDKKIMDAHVVVADDYGNYKIFDHTFTKKDADAIAEDGTSDMWIASVHMLKTAKDAGLLDKNSITHMASEWKNSVGALPLNGSLQFDPNKGISIYTNEYNLLTLNPEHSEAKILSKFSDYIIDVTASTRDWDITGKSSWNQRGLIGALGRVDFGADNKLSFTYGTYMPNAAVSYEHNRLTAKVGVVTSFSKINNLESPGEKFTWTALNGADKVTIDNKAHTIVASEPGIYNIEGVKGNKKVTVSYIVPHEDYLDHMVGGAFYVSEAPALSVVTYKGANGTANKYKGNNIFSVPVTNSTFKYAIPETYNYRVTLKGNNISFAVAPNGTANFAELYNSKETPLTLEQEGFMEASNKKTGTVTLFSNGSSRAWFKSVSVSLDLPAMPSGYLVSLGECRDVDDRIIYLSVGETLNLKEINFEVGPRYYNGEAVSFKKKPAGLSIVDGVSITAIKEGVYNLVAVAGGEEFEITVAVSPKGSVFNNGNYEFSYENGLITSYNRTDLTQPYSEKIIFPAEHADGHVYEVGSALAMGNPGNKQIVELEFEKYIQKIGSGAFLDATKLKVVKFPNTIETIGASAFAGAAKLTDVFLPASVSTIEDNAFRNCNNLKIVITNKDAVIGETAFTGDAVIIGYKGSTAEAYAIKNGLTFKEISGANLTKATNSIKDFEQIIYDRYNKVNKTVKFEIHSVESGGDWVYSLSGFSYTDRSAGKFLLPKQVEITVGGEKKTVSVYPGAGMMDSKVDSRAVYALELEEGVTSTGFWAFRNCYNLKYVELPESLTSIAQQTFLGCSSLETIDIPSAVTVIGLYAFDYCTSLREVNIDHNGMLQAYGTNAVRKSEIPGRVFYQTRVEKFVAPISVDWVTNSLVNFSSFKEVWIYNKDCYFSMASDAQEYYFPMNTVIHGVPGSTAEEIVKADKARGESEDYAERLLFRNLTFIGDLKDFYTEMEGVLDTNAKFFGSLVKYEQIKEDEYKLLENPYYVLSRYQGVGGKVVFPSHITVGGKRVPVYAISSSFQFEGVPTNGLPKIINLEMEDGIAVIEDEVFSNTPHLKSIKLPNTLKYIGKKAFTSSGISGELKIPATVQEIGNAAFRSLPELTDIYIYNPNMKFGGGIFDREIKIHGIPGSTAEEYAAKNRHEFIPIEDYKAPSAADYEDNGNYKFTIDGDGFITGYEIKDKSKDYSLKIKIPAKVNGKAVKGIKEGVFNDPAVAGSIIAVELEEGIEEIGARAFKGLLKLSFINFPKTIKIIGESAFENTALMGDITLPEGLQRIDRNAFKALNGISSFKILSRTVVIDPTGLTRTNPNLVVYGYTDSTAELWCQNFKINFQYLDGGPKPEIPPTVNYYEDTLNYKFTVDSDGYVIGYEILDPTKPYSGRIRIPAVINGVNVKGIKEGLFTDPAAAASVYIVDIDEGIEEIGTNAFKGLSNLFFVTIPSTIKVIGESAFEGTVLAGGYTLPEGLEKIGKNAFKDISTITFFVIYSRTVEIDPTGLLTANPNLVIYGYTGSTAELWCRNNNVLFQYLDGGPQPGTQDPGTQDPGTQDPGTQDPGTQDPGTQQPDNQTDGNKKPVQQDEPQSFNEVIRVIRQSNVGIVIIIAVGMLMLSVLLAAVVVVIVVIKKKQEMDEQLQ